MEFELHLHKIPDSVNNRVKKLSDLTGFDVALIYQAALLKALSIHATPTLPCPGVASERVGEPKLVREVLPEVVGGEELAPVMSLVDDLELGLREPEEEGRDE